MARDLSDKPLQERQTSEQPDGGTAGFLALVTLAGNEYTACP